MKIKNIIYSEFIKLKKSYIFIIMFLFPLINALATYVVFNDTLTSVNKKSFLASCKAWTYLFSERPVSTKWLFLMVALISVIIALIHSLDRDTNSLKTILATSLKRESYYIYKFFITFVLMIIVILTNIILLFIVGKVFGITAAIQIKSILKLLLFQILTIVGICAIQNYFSAFNKNIISSISIGVVGAIVGLGLCSEQPEIAKFFPYSYPVFLNKSKGLDVNTAIVFSLLYGLVFLVFGIIKFKRSDIS